MNDSRQPDHDDAAIERAVSFIEAALHICDEQGFVFAAIDLSSALDKLKGLQAGHPEQ